MINQNQNSITFNQALVSYVKKTLFLGSKEFYKKFAESRDTELLTLDAPVTNKGDIYFVDTIVDTSSDVVNEVCQHSKDIRDHLENKKLSQAMDCLNNIELCILYELFVEEKRMVDIGQELKVSKQYINKIKGQALRKIRNYLEIEVE